MNLLKVMMMATTLSFNVLAVSNGQADYLVVGGAQSASHGAQNLSGLPSESPIHGYHWTVRVMNGVKNLGALTAIIGAGVSIVDFSRVSSGLEPVLSPFFPKASYWSMLKAGLGFGVDNAMYYNALAYALPPYVAVAGASLMCLGYVARKTSLHLTKSAP
jgi:hypothetical protein